MGTIRPQRNASFQEPKWIAMRIDGTLKSTMTVKLIWIAQITIGRLQLRSTSLLMIIIPALAAM